jgi:hypothetical protein
MISMDFIFYLDTTLLFLITYEIYIAERMILFPSLFTLLLKFFKNKKIKK